ncbi:uncharacterized protein EI90DRAFT_3030988 [Cantharellus anzutake]|uniref:uncharacterized protein n=1 Tax=Cantharellus anzutake TaxID=1750568 RepID=UPI001906797E|nr:uncharacterized protein EI90DRAFT_3030988 [Cantharellus anzutake]KAF8342992.1 hypothetical protein EI90DRAFT_3030988 [Cantharellus anzutake]
MRGRRGYRSGGRPHRGSLAREMLTLRPPQFQIGTPLAGGRNIRENVSDILQTITLSEDEPGYDEEYVPSIINTQVIASYSWTDAEEPTILVPGALPVWQERSLPFSVPRDQGIQFIDQNAHRSELHPVLPLILSIRHISPRFDYGKINIITDRNGLRKLMSWAGKTATEPCEDFRIDVDVVGKDKNSTVLLTRWEARNHEEQRYGYGHNFLSAVTSEHWGCKGATSYSRILQYDFAGLTLLVRYSADAALTPTERSATASARADSDLDHLATQIASLNIGTSSKTATPSNNKTNSIEVIPTKHELSPQSSTIEIKSRTTRSYETFDWPHTLPQLFLSQTPYLYIGIHRQGYFERVVKHSMPISLRWDAKGKAAGDVIRADADMQKALDSAKHALKDLGRLLERLREIALEYARTQSEGFRMVLLCESGKLSLYRRSSEDKLPREVYDAFN